MAPNEDFPAMQDDTSTGPLPLWKKTVVALTVILTLVGIFDALENIPVVSGCAFYAKCHHENFRQPPGKLGRDPVK